MVISHGPWPGARRPRGIRPVAALLLALWSAVALAQQRTLRTDMLTLLPSPQPVTLADFTAGQHDLLLIVAVVNPFGPTVYGLDVVQRPGQSSRELVSFSLNPFSVTTAVQARVAAGASRAQLAQAAIDSGKDFGVLNAAAPTLVLPNIHIDDSFVKVLIYKLSRNADAFRSLDRLRRYPLRSYDRIMEEVDAGLANITGGASSDRPAPSRPITPGELAEYADTLLTPAHMRDELESFVMAWQGAIEFQRGQGNAARVPVVLPWENLVPVITTLTSPASGR